MFSRECATFLQNVPLNKAKLLRQLSKTVSSDVVVIGGGAMGASVAYWIKEKLTRSKNSKDLKVVVVEKDPTYSSCSTCLSVGGIRHQFALRENIEMSLFGSKFIETIKDRFGPEADVSYMPFGYLILGSVKGAEQLAENFRLQKELGASNELLSKEQLKTKFPWLNVDDVELGCLGGKGEGWFDPWGLLSLLKQGAIKKGAEFIQGETVNFVFGPNQELQGVEVQLPSKESKTINFEKCVITAGAESGNIARLAKIGAGPGELSMPLPVERRKRYVYRFGTQGDQAPEMSTPLTIDFTGAYFRRDGSEYIGGMSPDPKEEPQTDNLEVDFEFFDNRVWPLLAHRIPAFESAKIKSAWGGYYEYNTFDQNGIVGPHLYYKNLFFATGFSGHGIQQSPAAGLAIAELILDGKFQTVDLTRMGFERLVTNQPLYETEIY